MARECEHLPVAGCTSAALDGRDGGAKHRVITDGYTGGQLDGAGQGQPLRGRGLLWSEAQLSASRWWRRAVPRCGKRASSRAPIYPGRRQNARSASKVARQSTGGFTQRPMANQGHVGTMRLAAAACEHCACDGRRVGPGSGAHTRMQRVAVQCGRQAVASDCDSCCKRDSRRIHCIQALNACHSSCGVSEACRKSRN